MKLLSLPKPPSTITTTFNNIHENHHHQQQCSSLILFNNNTNKQNPVLKPHKNQNFNNWVPLMDSTTTITKHWPTTDHHHHHHHHFNTNNNRQQQQQTVTKKDKLIVIMGATGAGKTKLSIELAKLFNGEIINSDKIQLYKGLDITTNKVPIHERANVKHHLIGEFDTELTRSQFRNLASSKVKEIVGIKKVPFLVGGSNSFVHASLTETFDDDFDVFGFNSVDDSVSNELRYDCCFLWVDVSFNVLCDYLCKRVDEMVELGMVDELAEFYNSDSVSQQPGLRNAIGVPEFYRYFKGGCNNPLGRGLLYEDAVDEIKENTCQLAKRQIEKILRLKREVGWGLHRLNATASFRKVLTMTSGCEKEREEWRQLWVREVVDPSVKIVKRFLED